MEFILESALRDVHIATIVRLEIRKFVEHQVPTEIKFRKLFTQLNSSNAAVPDFCSKRQIF